jgi:PPM family protein phosphatase
VAHIVAELVQAGQLTEDQARCHPQRMVLTQALGVGPGLSPDMVSIVPEPDDRYLLCTDGLFNDVPETEIEAVLGTAAPPRDVVDRLVALAESHGGNDNVSVAVVDV